MIVTGEGILAITWNFLSFAGNLVVASLSQEFLGVGWTSQARVWIPLKLRGKCFGSRNRWLNVRTVFFPLLAFVLFEADATALWPYRAHHLRRGRPLRQPDLAA